MASQSTCRPLRIAVLFALSGALQPGAAQPFDAGTRLRDGIAALTEGALQLSFEQRVRYESRSANAFGKDPDLETGLARTRLGLSWRPAEWLKVSGTAQDARTPWYGPGAPTSARDTADLLEAYFELFGGSKSGFGMSAGRSALGYGDSRLIGTPGWNGRHGLPQIHAAMVRTTRRAVRIGGMTHARHRLPLASSRCTRSSHQRIPASAPTVEFSLLAS